MFPTAPVIDTKFDIFSDNKAGVIFAANYIKALSTYLKKTSNVVVYEQATLKDVKN